MLTNGPPANGPTNVERPWCCSISVPTMRTPPPSPSAARRKTMRNTMPKRFACCSPSAAGHSVAGLPRPADDAHPAMLANEALDVVNKGVASAEDTDLAMLRRQLSAARWPGRRARLAPHSGDAGKPATLLRRSALSPDAAAAPLRFPPLSRSRTMNANTPRALAQRCAEQMFQQDTASGDGDAHRCRRRRIHLRSATVGPQMLNGHLRPATAASCSAPADTALAYACNSRGLAAVGLGCHRLSARRWPAIASPPARRCAIRQSHRASATSKIVNQRGKPSHGSAAARTASASILGDQA